MLGERYRLKTPTLAIMANDGDRIAVTIPIHGEVEVVDGPMNGDRVVDVLWEGKTVMMFTTDLRELGERLDGAAAH